MFKELKNSDKAFIIAEVGQNHQGDLDVARDYIRAFAEAGADAVKFQTRNNKYLFSQDAYEASYDSENAFAPIYGEHREQLELKPEWLPILKEDCVKYGVQFMSTPFDEPSLELLKEIDVDILKIASFDLGNLPFMHHIVKMGKPVVISVGGGKAHQIRASIDFLGSALDDIAVLHCVSEYPCDYNRLGLSNIPSLIESFPQHTIGLSDHYNGIITGPIAYMLGARVFEKHVTFNRSWRGTDHSFALEPEGFRKFARDIRRTPKMMPPKDNLDLGNEPVFKKLGKSIIAARDIQAGETIVHDMLSGRIFREQFIPVRESVSVIGKRALRPIAKGAALGVDDFGNV
jgi:sialic acid synthase